MKNFLKNRSFKIVLFWSIFVLVDILIAAGIAEIWIRAFIPVKNVCYFVDDEIGVRYCPNQRNYGHVEEGYSNILITNSNGFHDIERTRSKAKGVFRVHIYGDSMIEGFGVQIDQTIPSRVEHYLSLYQPSVNFEVLNMAAGTVSTNAQIVTYEKIGKHFDADLVVCSFMDDFGDNVLELSGDNHSPYYTVDENNELVFSPPAPKNTQNFVGKLKRRWCRLYRLLANKFIESPFYWEFNSYKRKVIFKLNSVFNKDVQTDDVDWREVRSKIYINKSWPLTLRLFKFFNNKVERDGADFLLSDGRIFDDNVGIAYTNKDLGDYCKTNGIHYIPTYKVLNRLQTHDDPKEFFFNDGHPNQKGIDEISKFFARAISDYIEHKET